MSAIMIRDGKRVAAGGARLQWHMIPIADIDLIARNRFADVEGVKALKRSVLMNESNVGSSVGGWLLARADDVATDLFVALQL